MKPLLVIVIAASISGACSTSKPAQPEETFAATASLQDPVFEKVRIYCYACHNPSAPSHDDVIAPPLAAVKRRYAIEYGSKELSADAMTKFLLDPTEEKAIMYNAVKRFGLMAKTPADEQTTRDIVKFIHDKKLEEPVWFRNGME